jgi:hypothetical protein
MLKVIVNKFLERYHTDFILGGYSVHKVTHSPSISVLHMISDDYVLIFKFFNELPYRLLVDVHHCDQLKLNEKNKTVILNKELSFFPFNYHKHEIIDAIQKEICERLGICEVVDSIDDFIKSPSVNLYNARFNNKFFQVLPSMKKTVGGHQIFRLNNYVINITTDGEVFYNTKTYYSFDNDYFIFNNTDDLYSYCGVDYVEHELESLFFKIIVNRINNEIFKETEISLMHESEEFIKKAINVYKMLKI